MSGLKKIRIEKVVSSLPGTLQADTVYFVKNNSTYDLYITNGVGTIVAYPINKPIAAPNLLGNVIIGNNINVASDGTISVSIATDTIPGVVKVGNRLTINNGVLNFLVNSTTNYYQLSDQVSYNNTVLKNEINSTEKSLLYYNRLYIQSSGYIADINPSINYFSLLKSSDNSRISLLTNSNGLSSKFIETYYPIINTTHRILKITSYDGGSGSIDLSSIDWTNGSGLTLNEIAGNSILFQFNGNEVARIASNGTITTNNATIYLRRNLTDYTARRNWGFSTEQNATGDFQILESSTNTGIPINARFAILSGGNTGIGYVFPTQRLQVAGAVRITSNSNTLTELGVQLDFYDAGSTSRLASYKSTGADLDFYVTNTSGSLVQLLHLDKAGRVGVGISALDRTFIVNGQNCSYESNYPSFVFKQTTVNKIWDITYSHTTNGIGGLSINESGIQSPIFLQNGGYIGLGTDKPNSRVHISALSAINSNTILTLSGGSIGFNGSNDANISQSLNFDGCAYSIPTGIIEVTGAAIKMLKDGSWNEAAGGFGTKGILSFFTNNGNVATSQLLERLRITASGNVGIGTTNPGQKLEVAGDFMVGSNNKMGFRYSSTDANMYAYITCNHNGNIAPLRIVGGLETGSTTNEAIRFETATVNSVKLSILNNGNSTFYGNVTIAKDAAYLTLNGLNSDAEIYWQTNGSARWALGMNVGDATENWNLYNYTTASTIISVEKTSGNVRVYKPFFSEANTYLWGILQHNFEYWGWSIDANHFTSSSSWVGFSYAVNSPVVGTIASFSTSSGYCLQLQAGYEFGNLYFRARNGDYGMNQSNGWYAWYSVNLTSVSDERLKENWVALKKPLENLLSLRTGRFNYNQLALSKGIAVSQYGDIGFAAQDFKSFLPEVLSDSGIRVDDNDKNSEKYYQLHYEKVTVLIVAAFQEYVEKTEKRIKELEQKNQSILSKLFNFKKLW